MKETLSKHKTPVIILAAILLIGIGIAVGMGIMAQTSAAKGSSYIGAERAKTVALESVGVSPSKATFTKAELDRENGTPIYEIEFFSGVNEYEFEIDARTGTVLEKKSEALSQEQQISASSQSGTSTLPKASSQSGGTQGSSSNFIGIDRAKAIALKHAGISSSDAVFTKAKLDTDDGIRTYEIEFVSGDREYEYEINAYTGELLDISSEYRDDYYQHHEEGYRHHNPGAGMHGCRQYRACDL